MAYAHHGPGRTPQYLQPRFYPVPQSRDAFYARPLTPDPTDQQRKPRKKPHRWSFSDFPQQPREHLFTPPPTPMKPRRVLWEADFMWAPKSLRYPDLHPVLAVDTTRVIFDVRVSPGTAINPGAYTRFWNASALQRPTMHMRLVSRDHPWVFELDFRPLATRGTPHYVTCGDVWTALVSGLSQAMTDAEWSLLATADRTEQSQRKRSMTETVAMRKYEDGKYLRRVDWLGRNVIFHGLAKDESFARDVLLPGREPCSDTWVVRFRVAEIRA